MSFMALAVFCRASEMLLSPTLSVGPVVVLESSVGAEELL